MREGAAYRDISSYGVIGNLATCALVGRDGSIDWLCTPYLESPSVFGALLDRERGGRFSIAPVMSYDAAHTYRESTNILETEFVTPTGNVTMTDFMPPGQTPHLLIRRVEGIKGISWLRVFMEPRFDYGRARPRINLRDGGVTAEGGDAALHLQAPQGMEWLMSGDGATSTLTVARGQVYWFVLSWGGKTAYNGYACEKLLGDTEKYWQDWVNNYLHLRGVFDEPWRDVVIRSGLVLKLLISPDSGAIAAAGTSSLPEQIGGVRNWDYRFAWLRDSSFTIQALFHLGDLNELRGYNRWIGGIIGGAKDVAKIRAVYPLRTADDIRESIIDNFAGYADSGPVRLGNAAVEQWQLDIYGELINGIYETSRYGADLCAETWDMVRAMTTHVCRVWDRPDNGIWEFRGQPRHFVYSKLMCWVAIDRAVRIARMKGYNAPLASWLKVQEAVRRAILTKGFDAERNTFVQAFGSRALDATALLIPIMGLLPFTDERVKGTIEAVRQNLVTRHCLTYRYRDDDGLAGHEGCFTLCTFWLVKALALSGRMHEAEELFKDVLQYMSPLGLLSEEIDPASGRQLGNFPQAFSHIGLINASLYLGIAKGRRHPGPAPSGTAASAVKREKAAKTPALAR
jgi:GH15 family glucan-1,4-alpha-glucosidase